MPDADATAFVTRVGADVARGLSTEGTHRPTLRDLVEALGGHGVAATNEPRRVACGAPDFAVTRDTTHGPVSIGYIEAKDVGAALDTVERSDQLTRYRRSLVNLILTDNLEFRWYVDGDLRGTARLGRLTGGRVVDDPAGIDAVATLLRSFLAQTPAPATRPEDLALRLARLARLIHDVILSDFEAETASTSLQDLLGAFRTTLLPDLTPEQFADELAQTLAYGLFAARVYHTDPTPFKRQDAATDIPRTNPFIRQLIGAISGPSLDDEPFVGFVDDIAELLASTDIDSILENFGTRTQRHDPVVHFYETFLAQYDPRLREARGVYFTPEPVVSFIVRSVDEVLTTHFGLADGIADTATVPWQREGENAPEVELPRVQILDPATGTGTFPYIVIDEIRQRFAASGNAGRWSAYVHDQLLPRINAFELLVAPYVVAHLKLALELAGLDLPVADRPTWAYTFQRDERLNVYLTNSLEEATTPAGVLFARYISDEANAASEVKRDRPIMVVIGNPPYSGHSVNNSEWILRMLADYYRVDGAPIREANTKWLRDDYVKFIRFGQWRIERTGSGVLSYITNHRYLRNPTFRGMRQQLLRAFDEIYVLNLHGNRRMRESAPGGGVDRNVFDIEQGVAIGIFIRHTGSEEPARVFHAHLYGERADKYAYLDAHVRSTVAWQEIVPEAPNFLFEPRDAALQTEYEAALSVEATFRTHSLGSLTKRDGLTIAHTRDGVVDQVRRFLDPAKTDVQAGEEFGLPMHDRDRWDLPRNRTAARPLDPSRAERVLYRPFDWRWLYADPNLIARPNTRVLQHLRQPNFALLAGRQGESTGTE
ncbi:MAG: hypothetical protein QOJ81_1630, partial [Chloroflexota bacterium]|nr:hypothetical protein [Chloroflexota bacterium]